MCTNIRMYGCICIRRYITYFHKQKEKRKKVRNVRRAAPRLPSCTHRPSRNRSSGKCARCNLSDQAGRPAVTCVYMRVRTYACICVCVHMRVYACECICVCVHMLAATECLLAKQSKATQSKQIKQNNQSKAPYLTQGV